MNWFWKIWEFLFGDDIVSIPPCTRCPFLERELRETKALLDRLEEDRRLGSIRELELERQVQAMRDQVADSEIGPLQDRYLSLLQEHEVLSREHRHAVTSLQEKDKKIEELAVRSGAQDALIQGGLAEHQINRNLLIRAVALVSEPFPPAMSGEARRHRVYAQLLKDYPTQPKQDVGFAIELALRGVKRAQ